MGHRPSPILSTCLGKTPAALRPYLGGARRTALEKTSKAGAADVRPSRAGEAVPRLVGKALLRSDLPALRADLLPHQLAVGLPPEPKLFMPHLHRMAPALFGRHRSGVFVI